MTQFRVSRFLVGMLFALVSVTASFIMRGSLGWTFDFPLAALLAFAAYGSLYETAIISGTISWIINWTEKFSPEIFLVVALPVAFSLLKGAANPVKNTLYVFLFVVFGVFLFYGITSSAEIFYSFGQTFLIALGSGVWGTAVYLVLRATSR